MERPEKAPTLSALIARERADARRRVLGLDRRRATAGAAAVLGVAMVLAVGLRMADPAPGPGPETIAEPAAEPTILAAAARLGLPPFVGPPEDPFAPGRWKRPPVRSLATMPAADVLHALAADEPTARFDGKQPVPPTPYGELIYRTASRHRVNPLLVAAVVWTESAFDPAAVSVRDARGLMQVTPATGARFGLATEELFDPARNLDAGVRYLRWLADRFGDDLDRVLAAYNAGEGAVDRYGGIPPFPETRDYVRRVYSRLGVGDE